MTRRRLVIASATLCLTARSLQTQAAPIACEKLANASLPQATITAAQEIAAGEYTPPAGGRQALPTSGLRVPDTQPVAFYVGEHNRVLPHSAFRGQTPDEMYFGTKPHVARVSPLIRLR